jgi:hypothetical protein
MLDVSRTAAIIFIPHGWPIKAMNFCTPPFDPVVEGRLNVS